MQLKLQNFDSVGKRLIPKETPKRLLLTGPNIILSKRKVPIIYFKYCIYKLVYRPINTNKTLMSAGETPITLEACPTVLGWILVSFCRASVDKDCMSSYLI